MTSADRDFQDRADRIPVQGVGLSVDAHSPDLLELHARLNQAGLRSDYFEIFKAPASELARLRKALPQISFAYHGEGLWLTDPALHNQYKWGDQLRMIVEHAGTLNARWINLECASKQFGGYSFGTYLPPIFTRAVAEVTAENAKLCQRLLDEWYSFSGHPSPLLLIELPPLTYFAFGDVSASEFFAHLAEIAGCGFVLDIGHLWTVWRYREMRRLRRLDCFVADFLNSFPLQRIVQIHLAGLCSPDSESCGDTPWWVDAHEAPVPGVLWNLLERVLGHPGLTALKGIALEVDTKVIPLSIQEFKRLKRSTAGLKIVSRRQDDIRGSVGIARRGRECAKEETIRNRQVIGVYEAYGRVITGQEPLESSQLATYSQDTDRAGLDRYTNDYLPAEILAWGGNLEALFPKIWQALSERGIRGQDFVQFWFHRPRPIDEPYDFFNMKLRRWAEFVGIRAPDLCQEVSQEVALLLASHAELNGCDYH